MKRFIEAYANFISNYDPYYSNDQPENETDMIYNLREIEKDLIENDTQNEDPELWQLLRIAIDAYKIK